jgi:hypothetical protein
MKKSGDKRVEKTENEKPWATNVQQDRPIEMPSTADSWRGKTSRIVDNYEKYSTINLAKIWMKDLETGIMFGGRVGPPIGSIAAVWQTHLRNEGVVTSGSIGDSRWSENA